MKIWVIGRGYPTPSNRMWGSFELEQARMLARSGNDVSYISLTLSFLDRKDPRGLRSFMDGEVRVYAYSHFYFPGKLGIYLEGFEDKCWRRIFSEAEKGSGLPDIIHVHYPSMISSINEIDRYRRQGVRVFVTEHWSRVLINTLKKHELGRLQYYASNAECFAAVSDALEEAVKKRVNVTVPMKVIPNIVSPVFFDAQARQEKGGEFTFICVGRLVPLKQFDIVIKQYLDAFAGDDSVHLKIVGSGPERSKLEDIAGESSQVTFMGELSLEETAREVAGADALISFSRYETFAVPVAEAWACGKPAIVSSASGIAGYVTEDNGIVVDAKSQKTLGDAVKRIKEGYSRYNSAVIAGYAGEHFSDTAVVRSISEMYGHFV